MAFQRLNAMGEVVGKPTARPTSRIGQNNQRQVGISFGHEGSGKVYNYLASKNIRTGDIVTPYVTHPKSGKTYRTLGKVVFTRDSIGEPAQKTANYLSNKGILLKTIGPTDQTSLPGFKARKAKDPSFTVKKWAEEAKERKRNETMKRLNLFGDPYTGGSNEAK